MLRMRNFFFSFVKRARNGSKEIAWRQIRRSSMTDPHTEMSLGFVSIAHTQDDVCGAAHFPENLNEGSAYRTDCGPHLLFGIG